MERLTTLSINQLRDFATSLGIEFAPNISGTKLRQRIEDTLTEHDAMDKLEAYLEAVGSNEVQETVQVAVEAPVKPSKQRSFAARTKASANALVRFKLVCNDPSKANIPGEYFCIGNRVMGTIKRYIPYSQEFYDDKGWHAEKAVLDMLKAKYCYVKRQSRVNKDVRMQTTKLEKIKMFTITELPQLTPAELSVIAKAQRENVGE